MTSRMSGRGRPAALRGQRGVSSVTIHAVLAGLALVFAYMSWTRDRTQVKEDQPVVLDYGKRDVERLSYQDETRTVVVERKTGADGEPYPWVTVTTRSKTLLTNPGAPPPGPGGMPPGPGGAPMAPGAPHGMPGMAPHGMPAAPPPPPAATPSALRPVPTAPSAAS